MPELHTMASSRKDWKRISAESSVTYPRQPSVKGLNWTECQVVSGEVLAQSEIPRKCWGGGEDKSGYTKRGSTHTELEAPPPKVTVPQAFILTTMWHCTDWWTAQWFGSDFSIQMNVICFNWIFNCSWYFSSSMNMYHHLFWRFCSESTSLLLLRCALARLFGVFTRNINCDVLIGWNCWLIGSKEISVLHCFHQCFCIHSPRGLTFTWCGCYGLCLT